MNKVLIIMIISGMLSLLALSAAMAQLNGKRSNYESGANPFGSTGNASAKSSTDTDTNTNQSYGNNPKPGTSHTTGSKLETAYFAAGCFWKTQYIFSKVPGIVETRVGYSGGNLANPSYEQVCTHSTGHAETVKVVFDPAKVSYHHLLRMFWSHHDPTTKDRQGFDIGSNYRSAIFYTTPEQQKEAIAYKTELGKSHKFWGSIVTEIAPAAPFYNAEEYHQNYFIKHGEVCN